MNVDLMEEADRQILNAIFNTLPTKVSEDFFLTCKFHSHCGHSCSTILELVKFIYLTITEGWSVHRQTIVNAAPDMHFVHNVKSLSVEFLNFV